MKCNLKHKATRPDIEAGKMRALHWKPGKAEALLTCPISSSCLATFSEKSSLTFSTSTGTCCRASKWSLEQQEGNARVKSLTFLETHPESPD